MSEVEEPGKARRVPWWLPFAVVLAVVLGLWLLVSLSQQLAPMLYVLQ